MHGEEGRHHGAGPKAAGHLPKNQEQHDRGGRLQQGIDEVVCGGVHAKQLAVQEVRHAGQGVPVGNLLVREDPGDSPSGQSAEYVGIVVDITAVVEIDELETGRLNEHQPDGEQQQTAHGQPGATTVPLGRTGGWDLREGGRPLLDGALIVHQETTSCWDRQSP